jgi:hypothetical protein
LLLSEPPVVASSVDDNSVAVDVAEDEQDVLSSAQVNQVCMVTFVLRLLARVYLRLLTLLNQ